MLKSLLLFTFIFLPSMCALAQTSAIRARVTQSVDMRKMVTLRGNVHPLARQEPDVGVAPDDLPMERVLLVLQRAPEQEAALRQLLDDQQVKGSPRFHQWLTPEQFGRQFGPADSDLQAVTNWLGSQGFEVTKVSAGRTVIEFSGTAGLVRSALGTEIHRFAMNGHDYWANTDDPQIPAALAPVVAGFASLNNFPRQSNQSVNAYYRSQDTGEVHPLFTVSSGGTNYYALGPTDFATIYNVLPLWNAGIDGTGQTIAVVAETNIHVSDVSAFRSTFGLPAKNPQIILNGPDPGVNDEEMEADIDVEWSGAVARNATIDLVVSQTTETTAGIDLSALYIIDNNLAPVMSLSYGECEQFLGAAGNAFYSTTREQGAAEGITLISSAGDSGSARCDQSGDQAAAQNGLAVDGLASTPFDVAVGGTDFGDVNNWAQYWSTANSPSTYSSALSYIPETAWNSSCAASGQPSGCTSAGSDTPRGIDHLAGGGGPSSCGLWSGSGASATCLMGYPKPAWQTGNGVPNDGVRDIPDVSLFASSGTNHSFYAVCDADAIQGYLSCDPPAGSWYFASAGGTSVAAPDFAGIMALVNQKTGQRQGNANYVLYPLAAQPGATCTSNSAAVGNSNCIFYDVVSGNNSVACTQGSKNCKTQLSGAYGILVSPADNSTAAWTASPGYDLATGLGSVNAANLVNKWGSVTFSPTATSLSTLPQTITHGQPVNFTVGVTSGNGTPTGDVALLAQLSGTQKIAIDSFTLASDGSFSGSTDMLPGGSYDVIAHYAGDGTHGASDSDPQPVTVGKGSSQTKTSLAWCDYTSSTCTNNFTNMTYGAAYGFFLLRMDVTNAGGQPCVSPATGVIAYPCATGIVDATANGGPPQEQGAPLDSVPGIYKLNSQGYAEDQYTLLSGGTYNVLANYLGDSSYTPSTSAPVPVSINRASTTITLTAPSSLTGAFVNFAGTLNTQSYGLAPTGGIDFVSNVVTCNGYVAFGSAYSPQTGAYAQGQVVGGCNIPLPPGQATFTAQYKGDLNYLPSTSNSVTVTASDFTMSANPTALTIPGPGQSATSTIALTAYGGFASTVNFTCNLPAFAGLTCSVSPASVSLTGSNTVTALLTVSSTAPSGSRAYRPPYGSPRPPLPLPQWPWWLAATLLMAMLLSFAASRRPAVAWLFAAALLVELLMAACGGGGSPAVTTSPPAPSASLSPTTLTFSQQTVGNSSSPQTVTLSSVGNASLSISAIGFNGTNPGDFSTSNTCGGSVVAGTHCAIDVTFAPQGGGSRSASLYVSDNAAGSPQTVSLVGTGFGDPVVSLSATSLSFGQVALGSSGGPQTLTLANSGTSPVNFGSVGATSGDYIDFEDSFDNCFNAVVPPGGTCKVTLYFVPQAVGLRNTAFEFNDNAPGSPQKVSLSGTGVQPATPPGSYFVEVFSTSNLSGLGHRVDLTLTVQ